MDGLRIDIDRSSPVPLYFQAASQIERQIVSGSIAVGERLASEVALADELGLSRPTMRRAIQALVDKGLLVRKRGVGTQVVQQPMHRKVELTSLYDDLRRSGREPTTQVLALTTEAASDECAAELAIRPGSGVVRVERLRLTAGEPLALMVNYLPPELGVDDAAQLADNSLYDLIRRRGIRIRVARQRIGACAATPRQARLLHEKSGSPLLTMQRTAFDDTGRAVEFGTHVYRPDLYSFDITLVDR